jgi:hypothetical protein
MSWEMTLQSIRDEGPCQSGWEKLRKSIGARKPLSTVVTLEQILESNGVRDAQWALRCIEGHAREIRLYAAQCACRVRRLMPDPRSIYALECSVLYAEGMEDDAARDAAWDAAWDAAGAAAWDAAGAAAWAAAGAAAWAAAWAAARDAAWDAAWDAAGAAAWAAAGAAARAAAGTAAGDAAWDAARAARSAERKWQAEEMIRMIRGEGIYDRSWADGL